MANERTLILVKPDGVKRNLIGEIINRFEKKGLKILGIKMLRFDDSLADRHYAEHLDKPFFPPLKIFIKSGPVVAMALEGEEVISVCRNLMGATAFTDALPGTIRGDYALSVRENLVHGSDSPASAEREIPLFFKPEELVG